MEALILVLVVIGGTVFTVAGLYLAHLVGETIIRWLGLNRKT